jgi:hypothetical protein
MLQLSSGAQTQEDFQILFNQRPNYKSDVKKQSTWPSRSSKDTNTFSVTRAATLTLMHLASWTDAQCIKV